jgi:hypothetical protein
MSNSQPANLPGETCHLQIATCSLNTGPLFAGISQTVVMDNERNVSINQQNHPHQEGQENNMTPQQPGSGQRSTVNNSMNMGNMLNESAEQDNDNLQQKERDVQQDERQP